MSKLNLATKSIALVIAVIAIAVTAFASTLALIIVKTNEIVNTFEAGKIEITVDVANGQVINNSDVEVYVRVAIVANYQDAAGNIYFGAEKGTDYTVATDANWEYDSTNDIYYYKTKIESGGSVALPTVTISTPIKNSRTLKVAYLATGIQGNLHDTYTGAWGIANS